MSSPNPFNLPPVDQPQESTLLHDCHSSWAPTSTIEAPLTAPPTLFREVPALLYLVLHRGRAMIHVETNSLRHMQLTGNAGTPTPFGSQPRFDSLEDYARWNVATEYISPTLVDHATLHCRARSDVVLHTFHAVLVESPADLAETVGLRSLSPQVSTSLPTTIKLEPADDFSEGLASPVPQHEVVDGVGISSHSPEDVQVGRAVFPDVYGSPEASEDRGHPQDDEALERVGDEERCTQRSPYNLRSRTRQLIAQIRVQAQVKGIPLDRALLNEAKIRKYNPSLPTRPSARSLLHSCHFGLRGITVTEFGSILLCCRRCDHYIFKGSTELHACKPLERLPDVTSGDFQLTSELLLMKEFPRLAEEDMEKLFDLCDTCHRVHSTRFSAIHKCPMFRF